MKKTEARKHWQKYRPDYEARGLPFPSLGQARLIWKEVKEALREKEERQEKYRPKEEGEALLFDCTLQELEDKAHRSVYHYAKGKGLHYSRDDAGDAIQEALLEVWEDKEAFSSFAKERDIPLSAALCSKARNKYRAECRRQAKRINLSSYLIGEEEGKASWKNNHIGQSERAFLSVEFKEALKETFDREEQETVKGILAGMTQKEIGEALGITSRTVRRKYANIRYFLGYLTGENVIKKRPSKYQGLRLRISIGQALPIPTRPKEEAGQDTREALLQSPSGRIAQEYLETGPSLSFQRAINYKGEEYIKRIETKPSKEIRPFTTLAGEGLKLRPSKFRQALHYEGQALPERPFRVKEKRQALHSSLSRPLQWYKEKITIHDHSQKLMREALEEA